ncbi:putative transcription factor GRAS family [Helianthus annuus]|nr:putative transcription factor GRAS family [Helianthus annuus]
MTSGFSGGYPDFFNAKRGGVNNVVGRSVSSMMNANNVNRSSYMQQLNYRSPVIEPQCELNRKRSLLEFQQNHQFRQQASVYLRNVKPRYVMSDFQSNDYYGRIQNDPVSVNLETDRKMKNRLQELEKKLFLDDEEEQNDGVSAVTDTELSETIQKLLSPVKAEKPETTSSSSSSCASSSSTISPRQLISNAADAISDGKSEIVVELITRLNQISNARGTPEQRLGFYMACALRSRLRVNSTAEEQPCSATELYTKEHILSTQLLYDVSPCFKLAFMAANNVILQTLSGSGRPERNIHVVDFDIGHGIQYVYLIHAIAAARRVDYGTPITLKLTTFKDFSNESVERLKLVGDGLKSLSNKLNVSFDYNALDFKLSEISKQGLAVANDDVLAVNFAFKLNKLPDESVTTENLRDEVLRRVKRLSPAVVTVAEQELNTNTASFTARVNELFSYYTKLVDSFDSGVPMDNSKRVKIEEGLSRRIVNSVACEGRDRVERCEVFGKWRARMRMAGFESNPVSDTELLLSKLKFGTRGNPGFTVKEESGGICIGWLGRTLTVVSAWH